MSQFLSNVTSVLIQDGQIYAQNFSGNQLIGMTIEKYRDLEKLANEATAKADEYRKKLVDAGIIQPKLTPEEQIARLTEQVSTLAGALNLQNRQNQDLTRKVNELTELLTTPDPMKKEGA